MRSGLFLIVPVAAFVSLQIGRGRDLNAQDGAVEPPASSFLQCGSVRVALTDDQWRVVATRCSQITQLAGISGYLR